MRHPRHRVSFVAQAEAQRLLDAEAVAQARVREVERDVGRVRDELAELEEKERTALDLKATHAGERGAVRALSLWFTQMNWERRY